MKQLYIILLLQTFTLQMSHSKSIYHDFYDITPYTKQYSSYAYDINISNTNIPNIDPRYEKLMKELVYMQVFAVATIGVIAALPEGVSNWSDEDKSFTGVQELLDKHANHLEEGPKRDNDNFAINYVGHSLVGSYFYVWGRQSGLTWQESAMLTTLMSTFFWEYGWEAFAEVPSTQDLIVTPLLGSLLGEGTNYLYNSIMNNNGKLYDSYILGKFGRVLLNPIGEMNMYFDKAFDAVNIEISVDYSYNEDIDNYRFRNTLENNRQLQSYFKLNFKFKY